MTDLKDGESIEVKGSAAKPYVIKNVGGVYSCTCPAWLHQSLPIEKRTCKHIRKLRGDDKEKERLSESLLPVRARSNEPGSEKQGPPILLAEKWDNTSDLKDWWMSEKLDGVRAFWDGKRFMSRQGNEYLAPDWFVSGLPEVPLDGELWLDRKSFQRTISIVRRQDRGDRWKEIKFLIFDAPSDSGGFETRMDRLKELFSSKRTDHAFLLQQTRCLGLDHLREELSRVESLGGEGLMMRAPHSDYHVGRSQTLLKVKSFHERDGVVVAYHSGRGRHKGRLGALLVRMEDGTEFSVGTGFTDAQRENPPPPGSVITFRYQELSDGGVPRFPSFVRHRTELSDSAVSVSPPQASTDNKPESIGEIQPNARYFELSDDRSHKFWEIAVRENEVIVRYGRIGSKGITSMKSFNDPASALAHTQKLILQKTGKGYVEQ